MVVVNLIVAEAEVDKLWTESNTTAVFAAARLGRLDIAKALVAAGADISKSASCTSPLYAAVLRGMRKKERAGRRHELLACVAQARGEQDAGRGEALHPLLNKIAKLRRRSSGISSSRTTDSWTP